MSGEHGHVARNGRKARERFRHRVGVTAGQVGAADTARKQRVAGDEEFLLSLRDDVARAAGRVSGRVQRFDRHVPGGENVAVAHDMIGFDRFDGIAELGGQVLGEVALTPTRIYVKQVLDVIRNCDVHGVAHITGGGFDENIPRILREGQGIFIEEGTWEILPIFKFLEAKGNIPHREMFNIFNMGVGMVLALDASEAQKAIDILAKYGDKATVIGKVTDKPGVDIKLK